MKAEIEANLMATWPLVAWDVTVQGNTVTVAYPYGVMYQSPMISQVEAWAREFLKTSVKVEIIRRRMV